MGATAIVEFSMKEKCAHVAAFLRNAGIQVKIVGNGIEALEAVNQHEFDLVLMDIHLKSRMNGIDAAQLKLPSG